VVTLASSPLAHSSDDKDHERARQALQTGQVLPLGTVLERLSQSHPGQVLEVELENEGRRWVYDIKLLRNNGQLVKMEMDARTLEVLRSRTKRD
jgi:uncharacterized membrane protein YkoI